MSYFDSNDRDRADEREGPYLRWNAQCLDCGDRIEVRPLEVARCDRCVADRERWAAAYKVRMLKASLPVAEPSQPVSTRLNTAPVVEVALVPVTDGPVVEVALVPIGVELKKLAQAVLSADLSTIKEVA